MVIENIVTVIITAVAYGIILLGCIIPIVFMIRTKHSIKKFGYKKYILIIVGLEILLLISAVVVFFLCTNSFYHSITWNRQGINMEFPIMLYQFMLIYILPLYLLVIAVAGLYAKYKERHSKSLR